ncbi:hypothetical protein [Frankia sp. AiPa1]|uniref:hypothetical protein n=1 Tax=Frankia sp. AiPa1 TaxID=573492 RepID=UPI00202B7043|nr:hypothetical protein [Frankia sp. AiPa1]MCL9762772.1 hypothetical protein [Frankia sp. AiPa1]
MADFQLVSRYRYRPADPLAVRVHLVKGADDPHVASEALDGWARECSEPPTLLEVPGAHFYFDEDPAVSPACSVRSADRATCAVHREPAASTWN